MLPVTHAGSAATTPGRHILTPHRTATRHRNLTITGPTAAGAPQPPLVCEWQPAAAANGDAPPPRDCLPQIDWSLMDGVLLLRAGHQMTLASLVVTQIRYGAPGARPAARAQRRPAAGVTRPGPHSTHPRYGPGAGPEFLWGEGPASVVAFVNVVWRSPVCMPPAGSGPAPAGGNSSAGGAGAGGRIAVVAVSGRECLRDASGGEECFVFSLEADAGRLAVAPRAEDLGAEGGDGVSGGSRGVENLPGGGVYTCAAQRALPAARARALGRARRPPSPLCYSGAAARAHRRWRNSAATTTAGGRSPT